MMTAQGSKLTGNEQSPSIYNRHKLYHEWYVMLKNEIT